MVLVTMLAQALRCISASQLNEIRYSGALFRPCWLHSYMAMPDPRKATAWNAAKEIIALALCKTLASFCSEAVPQFLSNYSKQRLPTKQASVISRPLAIAAASVRRPRPPVGRAAGWPKPQALVIAAASMRRAPERLARHTRLEILDEERLLRELPPLGSADP